MDTKKNPKAAKGDEPIFLNCLEGRSKGRLIGLLFGTQNRHLGSVTMVRSKSEYEVLHNGGRDRRGYELANRDVKTIV